MTQPDAYFPETAINANPGFSAYASATQDDWEAQIRGGWIGTLNPLDMFFHGLADLVDQIPFIGPWIAGAILGIDAVIDDLVPWFGDLRSLLGNPLGMGSGNPVLGAIENIPLLGPVVTALEGVPIIGDLVEALTGTVGTLADLATWASTQVAQLVDGLLDLSWIPSLTSGWGGTVDGSLLTGALNTATTIAGNALSDLFDAGGVLGSAVTGAINTGATIAGNALSDLFDAAGVLGSAISGAVNGAIVTGVTIGNSIIDEVQSVWNGIYNNLFGAAETAATQTYADAAVAATAVTITGHSNNIAEIGNAASTAYGYGLSGGLNVSVPFSGSIPSGFTSRGSSVYTYDTACQTDTQEVSAVWTSGTTASLLLRASTTATTWVKLQCSTSAGVNSYNIYTKVGGGSDTGRATGTLPSLANSLISFSCSGYVYTVKVNGIVAATWNDSGHISQVGASYRTAGFVSASPPFSQWNFLDKDLLAGPATAYVSTRQTTASATYANLTTTTDEVTVNIGPSGMALVTLSGWLDNDTADGTAWMGFALSGANTASASDAQAIMYQAYTGGGSAVLSAPFLLTDLTAGATTFKAKYKAPDAGTAGFADRGIAAIPL